MQKEFKGESITFIETQSVKEGVVCNVYSFDNNSEKDLGIISVAKNTCTPLQKILKGEKTVEGYIEGKGILSIKKQNGEEIKLKFPGDQESVELHIGDVMQWCAGGSGLTFYEICYPPYEDGRFENLTN